MTLNFLIPISFPISFSSIVNYSSKKILENQSPSTRTQFCEHKPARNPLTPSDALDLLFSEFPTDFFFVFYSLSFCQNFESFGGFWGNLYCEEDFGGFTRVCKKSKPELKII